MSERFTFIVGNGPDGWSATFNGTGEAVIGFATRKDSKVEAMVEAFNSGVRNHCFIQGLTLHGERQATIKEGATDGTKGN